MLKLRNRLEDRWVEGKGTQATLVDPVSGEELATTSTEGLDLGAALDHARRVGGPALRAMTFAERGALLMRMSKAVHGHREELIDLAMKNGGNTRGDAKFDLDGATGTLASYAALGKKLGDTRSWPDGEPIDMGSSSRMQGRHVRVPRRGVAIHLNAFNFPAWGMLEKVACAFLGGMPVLTKPSTDTALVAHRVVEILVDEADLPAGALAFLCGSAGDLLDHVGFQDCIAFTGSARTGAVIRTHPRVVASGARVNVEADSLNAAVLGPDVEDDAEVFDLFIRDVSTELRQKTGQKCTAIRRVLVPEGKVDAVVGRLREELDRLVVGAPAADGVRMGPLSGPRQKKDAAARLDELLGCTEVVIGGEGTKTFVEAGDADAFMAPTVLLARDPRAAHAVHEVECFGPVTTILPYSGEAAEAAELVALGQGSLVTSFYTDDRAFAASFLEEALPYQGRVVWGSSRVAGTAPTPGIVLPDFLHGGPGRAGGGEELGGLRGVELYTQRVAVQGFGPLLDKILG